jgi:hypothetical protein
MPKRSSKRKRRSKALPALGFAGVSLSMASGACASTGEASANTPPTSPSQSREIFLGEEEISDVSLATFYVFDKENTGQPPPAQQLRLARCGGCGCGCHGGGGGCGCGGWHGGGGACMGAGVIGRPGGAWGCHAGFGRCRCGGFFFRRCFGCGCGGCGCGGCGGTCWIWTPGWGWVYTCWAESTPPAQAAPLAEVSRVASEQSVQTAEIAEKNNDGSIVAKRTK